VLEKIAYVGSGEGINTFASLCCLIPMEATEKPFQTGPGPRVKKIDHFFSKIIEIQRDLPGPILKIADFFIWN
jgi:hypothetical protein